MMLCVGGTASASVQPLILPETAAENEETECRAENERQRSTQRRGMQRQTFNHRAHSRRRRIFFIMLHFLFEPVKLQTKPKTSIEKPASEETESTPTPLSEPFAPSVEPESSEQPATKSTEESGDHADNEKDALTGWREPEGSKAEVKRAASRRQEKSILTIHDFMTLK